MSRSKFRAWLDSTSLTRAQRMVVANAVHHCEELHAPGTCEREACKRAAALIGAEIGDVFPKILKLRRGRHRLRGARRHHA